MSRIAIIDSGIHAGHPHIGGISGGVPIVSGDLIDRIGHGTAVAAAIREKAPQAEIFAVKVFDLKLSTSVQILVSAIEWCNENRMDWINLSLGTANQDHAEMLQRAVNETKAIVISAYEHEGVRWLPGSLPGTVPVLLDWDCPRDTCLREPLSDGRTAYRASGYPRPIPGVPPARNLKGISFAVANVTGWLAGLKSPVEVADELSLRE